MMYLEVIYNFPMKPIYEKCLAETDDLKVAKINKIFGDGENEDRYYNKLNDREQKIYMDNYWQREKQEALQLKEKANEK